MIFQDFNVFKDDGKTLVEELPAIIYLDRDNIIAQVPSGTTSVTFTEISTGQTYMETVTNGKATFTPTANDTYRVGNETITKHNEITITGIKTLEDVKNEKLVELEQAYQSAFTTFQSSVLGTVKTYPITTEAQTDLEDLQNRLIADPNKSSFYFLTLEDGILIKHTRAQFLQLLEDAETRKVSIHNQNRTYANQINASTDIATIQAMTFTFN
jgi:hypothetical protein